VELVAPAISSPTPTMFSGKDGEQTAAAVRVALPHLKYLDGIRHGFVLIDLTPMLMTASWIFSPDVRVHSDAETAGATLVCERGSCHLAMA
jgi:hypothetical protein